MLHLIDDSDNEDLEQPINLPVEDEVLDDTPKNQEEEELMSDEALFAFLHEELKTDSKLQPIEEPVQQSKPQPEENDDELLLRMLGEKTPEPESNDDDDSDNESVEMETDTATVVDDGEQFKFNDDELDLDDVDNLMNQLKEEKKRGRKKGTKVKLTTAMSDGLKKTRRGRGMKAIERREKKKQEKKEKIKQLQKEIDQLDREIEDFESRYNPKPKQNVDAELIKQKIEQDKRLEGLLALLMS